MPNELLNLASTQGIWAALSIVLIFYILKAQERRDIRQDDRDHKYQKIILELTEKLEITKQILDYVSEIKK